MLLLALLPVWTTAEGGAGIFPYPTRVETLDNGLEVIVVPMSSGGLVAYWTVVRTGARDEIEPGRTGFAHFFEHMMFRGTEKYPAAVYEKMITEIGASTNAFTSDDLTAYHLGFAGEDLETVMELESDRFQHLSYAESAFKTEAGAVFGEYRKVRTQPMFVLLEALAGTAFEKHTYGHLAIGYPEDIERMPTLFDHSRDFFSRYYRPDNVALLIVGDVDVEATVELAREYYGAWEPGYVTPDVPAEPPQTAERRVDVTYEGSTLPVVRLAYKSPAFDPSSVELMAADLLCELAFGETSDIYEKLVLKEQVVEFISAGQPFNRDPTLLSITSRVKDPEKIDYVLAEIDRVIGRFQSEPPDPARLADLQSRLKYGFLMRLDTPDHVARSLYRLIALSGSFGVDGIEAVDTLYDTYGRVTPEDVRQAAREILRSRRRTIAVLRGES